jgi:hypothetical protein
VVVDFAFFSDTEGEICPGCDVGALLLHLLEQVLNTRRPAGFPSPGSRIEGDCVDVFCD